MFFLGINEGKSCFSAFIALKKWESFGSMKKLRIFAAHFRKVSIGVWCNGNTTDSGPVILGSNPSTPTTKEGSAIDAEPSLLCSVEKKWG